MARFREDRGRAAARAAARVAAGAAARATLVAAALVGVAACGDVLGGDDARETTLSFSAVRQGTAAGDLAAAASAADVITGAGHSVDVQAVTLQIDEVKLERVRARDERDSDSEDEADSDARDDEVFRSGATTVVLPLSGGPISPISQTIPAGQYDEVQLKVRALRLAGTYDGQPFDVTVPVSTKIESRLDPPFVVSASGDRPNVTVRVDVPSWFRSANGGVIDPRRLLTDGALQAAFRNRVRASFRAIEDADRDGDDADSDSDGL